MTFYEIDEREEEYTLTKRLAGAYLILMFTYVYRTRR